MRSCIAVEVSTMGHSVSGHLALQVADYDKLLRRLVPAYDRMRSVQLSALALTLPGWDGDPARTGLGRDLGGAPGALGESVAEGFPSVRVEIWVTDPVMLQSAAGRGAPWGRR